MTITDKTAIIIAHPGHELFVSRWLRKVSPLTIVITDGSGRKSVARIDFTRDLIKSCGGKIGSIFGKYKDIEFYNLILSKKN